jgi:serine-type D-Ala-D-Ala carboxypeptidase/endopeptidase
MVFVRDAREISVRTGLWLVFGLLAVFSSATFALTQAELEGLLKARFESDRTGACVLAAVVERDTVIRSRYCALPRADGGPAMSAAFEIGSISKTLTAVLVARLVNEGRWSLDDPIAKHLPPGTQLPRQGERQILVRDIVTHSSGLPALPALMKVSNGDDPYASLTERQLLDSLAAVPLIAPIGSQLQYSNFAMMVLSYAVTWALGGDLETAMREQLFRPMGMRGAYVHKPPAGHVAAQGHQSTASATSAWHIAAPLAGVGMVRATLDDMVAYAQAALTPDTSALGRALRLTLQPLAHGLGMNWALPVLQGQQLALHEGSTGGFSSLLLLQPAQRRAVVLLSDTALTDLGGLSDLGLSLIDLTPAPQAPRLATAMPAALRDALVGEYALAGQRLRIRSGNASGTDSAQLLMQVNGQAEFELLRDSRGDLYPTSFSALLSPRLEAGRVAGFDWRQGGSVVEARRVGLAPLQYTASNPAWKDWAGVYALLPGFELRVFEDAGRLMVQGSGQPAAEAQVIDQDRIEVKAVGAVFVFERNARAEVTGLTLQQRGQSLPAKKRMP